MVMYSPGIHKCFQILMINLVAIELGLWGSKLYCDLLLFFSSEPRLDFISLSTALWEAIPRQLSQAVVQPLSRV